MKKILILTVTAGNGHNACAAGMKRKLEENGGVEVKVIDILKCYSSRLNVWLADNGYTFAAKRAPKIYNFFYEHYRHTDPKKRYSCAAQGAAVSAVKGLLKEILCFKPDVIYCTHFYGAIALTDLKLSYPLPCKTVVSNLDYVHSPWWEGAVGVDAFAIPNEDFIGDCIRLGFKRGQLLPFGLPVDGRTLEKTDKSEARKSLGLRDGAFTVMIMFGGGSFGESYKTFKQVLKALKGKTAQIIMINGKNEKSRKKIAEIKPAAGIKVLNVGFTKEVPLYLSAADLVINKYGGTSATEIINKGCPALITENLAGQENHNLAYMKKKGVALSFKNGKQLKERLLYLYGNPQVLREMSKNCGPLKSDGINLLADYILSQPKADYSEILNSDIDFEKAVKTVKTALKAADKAERKNK